MHFSMGYVPDELVNLLSPYISLAFGQVACFPASTYGAKQTGAGRAELRQQTRLFDKALRYGWEADLDEVVISVGQFDVLFYSLDPGVQLTYVGENCSGPASRLRLSLLSTKLRSFSVLPPWDSYGRTDSYHREDCLNPSRRFFPQPYLASEGEKNKGSNEAHGDQPHVQQNRRPADSFHQFHVDFAPIHGGGHSFPCRSGMADDAFEELQGHYPGRETACASGEAAALQRL